MIVLLRAAWNWLTSWRWGVPPPPMLYTDPSGQGWAQAPDYQESHAPDIGQHDVWKRELRLALWRYSQGKYDQAMYDRRDAGITRFSDPKVYGPLFPVMADVSCACRRVGFARLARAAMPGVTNETLAAFWTENEVTARVSAAAQHAQCVKTNAEVQAITFGTEDELFGMKSLGPINAHDQYGPLVPFAVKTPPTPDSVTRFR